MRSASRLTRAGTTDRMLFVTGKVASANRPQDGHRRGCSLLWLLAHLPLGGWMSGQGQSAALFFVIGSYSMRRVRSEVGAVRLGKQISAPLSRRNFSLSS